MELSTWLACNESELSTEKTEDMIFKAKNKNINRELDLRFYQNKIGYVMTYKFLGVYSHEKLNWSHHIDQIQPNISREIGTINKLEYTLPGRLKRQLYFTHLHSRSRYCSLVWGTCSKTCLSQLFILQKRAVRSIPNASYQEHTGPDFTKYSQFLP